jgi:hypothetical protein
MIGKHQSLINTTGKGEKLASLVRALSTKPQAFVNL